MSRKNGTAFISSRCIASWLQRSDGAWLEEDFREIYKRCRSSDPRWSQESPVTWPTAKSSRMFLRFSNSKSLTASKMGGLSETGGRR